MDFNSLMAAMATDMCILVTSAVVPGSRPQLWIPKSAVSTRDTLGAGGGESSRREREPEREREREKESRQASEWGRDRGHSLMSCNLSMSTSSSQEQYACREYSTRAGDRKSKKKMSEGGSVNLQDGIHLRHVAASPQQPGAHRCQNHRHPI